MPVQVEPPSSTIWGKVCEDTDQDGVCDSGEPPLPFVSIALLDEDLDEVDTFTTGYAGVYEFTVTDIESGDTYYVVETDPPGYTSVNSNVIEVEVEPGERIYAGDFCDYLESGETPTSTPTPMTTPTATQTPSFTPTPTPTSTPTNTLTPTITPTNGGWADNIYLPVVLVDENSQ
jgi:hypothetical protein